MFGSSRAQILTHCNIYSVYEKNCEFMFLIKVVVQIESDSHKRMRNILISKPLFGLLVLP